MIPRSRISLARSGPLSLALTALLTIPTSSHAQSLNTATGHSALFSDTTGSYNSAYGAFALVYNTTGSNNTAIGNQSLYANTTGIGNTALGGYALYFNLAGAYNTAVGLGALTTNNGGGENTGVGAYALWANVNGYYNTASGVEALYSNLGGGLVQLGFNDLFGSNNVASGYRALYSNTTGYNNTAAGVQALYSNTTGFNNSANGYLSLFLNTTGVSNMATGDRSMYSNTTGQGNVANGYEALAGNTVGSYNVASGAGALELNTAGSSNSALGYQAGYNNTTGSNNIEIGNMGLATDGTATNSGVIRLGDPNYQTSTFIAGISGVTSSGGVAVYINANGQLGTLTSSRRFKNDIKDIGSASDKLMQLRPVSFRYKDSAEKGPHLKQYGLIAEEVAKVFPELVQFDKQGKPFTVYYHLLTPMLLNELQKERRRTDAQRLELAALKSSEAGRKSETVLMKAMKAMKAKIAALTATLQQQKSDLTKKLADQELHHATEIATLNSQLSSMRTAQDQQMELLTRLAAAQGPLPNSSSLHTTALIPQSQ